MESGFVKFSLMNPLTSKRKKRGDTVPDNANTKKCVVDHTNKFKPQLSHYNLSHAPNRRYLNPQLSIQYLWEDYLLNIGFGRLSQDECDVCQFCADHEHPATKETDSDNCKAAKQHLENVHIARQAYYEEGKSAIIDEKRITLAVDMQKVLQLPKLTLKAQFFVSHLTVFNETFCDLKGNKDVFVLWHEAEGGRCASDVASAYWKFISTMSEFNSFTIWCNNCCSQNKN